MVDQSVRIDGLHQGPGGRVILNGYCLLQFVCFRNRIHPMGVVGRSGLLIDLKSWRDEMSLDHIAVLVMAILRSQSQAILIWFSDGGTEATSGQLIFERRCKHLL